MSVCSKCVTMSSLTHRHEGVNQRVGGRRRRQRFVTVVFASYPSYRRPSPLPLIFYPPSSLCSGRASHSEQQAAGGDDIICTAAHCSIGSEQRHVSLTLTISSLPSLRLSVSLPPHQPKTPLCSPLPPHPPPESRSQSGKGCSPLLHLPHVGR